MTSTAAPNHAAQPESTTVSDGDLGWYLYGIVRHGSIDAGQHPPLLIADCGRVAAVTRTVSIAEFSDAALQKRLQDPGALASLASDHNAVVDAIHRQTAILPAKFGGVYARVEDLLAAIESQHEALAAQLDRVEGCDEWAVHVYLDRDRFRDDIVTSDPMLSQLRQEVDAASPGRAYLLQRRLAEAIARATDQRWAGIARECFEKLKRAAVATHASVPPHAGSQRRDEIQILRAAFLVRRELLDRFIAEIDEFHVTHAGLRCEHSGPWPPYSFASPDEEAPE